jgi:hypothetical protein
MSNEMDWAAKVMFDEGLKHRREVKMGKVSATPAKM